ncbi:hypothetical protein ACVI1I_006220 [Bradyrhizobium sp. USDA 4459]
MCLADYSLALAEIDPIDNHLILMSIETIRKTTNEQQHVRPTVSDARGRS